MHPCILTCTVPFLLPLLFPPFLLIPLLPSSFLLRPSFVPSFLLLQWKEAVLPRRIMSTCSHLVFILFIFIVGVWESGQSGQFAYQTEKAVRNTLLGDTLDAIDNVDDIWQYVQNGTEGDRRGQKGIEGDRRG